MEALAKDSLHEDNGFSREKGFPFPHSAGSSLSMILYILYHNITSIQIGLRLPFVEDKLG